MMQTIRIETDARGVADLWLARPEKHNAMDGAMIAELTEAAGILGADPAVRAVVLRGEGRSFCAGGDLTWMQAQMEADRAQRMVEARKLADMLGALDRMPKPLVAAVTGNVFGGGLGLVSVCDTVVAADHVRFALTETRLGLIPAAIGPYVVSRLGGPRARRVFMSSRAFGAKEAVALGLVARAVPADDLEGAVATEVDPYLSCAPGAVATAKALVASLSGAVTPAMVDISVDALADRWETEEARTGVACFFDKTPPPWAG
ncbi:crotonase/enoyl-CoA hydratase family protein [Rhodobacterales bacterium HKCCE2091]|nr:crotonase/enoyl-CoA hydratase family protein [Rhodobacterales bacterium HKCCE2091]